MMGGINMISWLIVSNGLLVGLVTYLVILNSKSNTKMELKDDKRIKDLVESKEVNYEMIRTLERMDHVNNTNTQSLHQDLMSMMSKIEAYNLNIVTELKDLNRNRRTN